MAQPGQWSGLQVINAGLFRTATKSMAEAYRILGYKTHHGLDDALGNPWRLIEQAAEATWPTVPDARPRPPYTREDWDEIWAGYDAVTDLASPFAPELIRAYPAAKVVIVKRDFEPWWTSFQTELLDSLFMRGDTVILFLSDKLLGIRAGHAMRKVHFGFFGAKNRREINEHARRAYEGYYEGILESVPEERRLVYRLGSGWEPLCEFLGKDIPDVAFPQANDKARHSATTKERHHKMAVDAWNLVKPWAFSIAALGVAGLCVWAMR